VQSVLEVPPAFAQPAAALIGAALTGLTAIAHQSAIASLSRPWACWLAPFVRSWLPLLANLGLIDQLLALGGFPAEHVQW
jgi:hypothetical protein